MSDDPSESEHSIERLIAAGEKLFRKARKVSEKYEEVTREKPSPLKEGVEPAANDEQSQPSSPSPTP